ncbi:MAG TPA: hypothetical protein VFT13_09055 [Candidatus Krumholzibacteria bacterium]|nr:hypothetical protein [Candidatus Krumholzibacteria bacterium]
MKKIAAAMMVMFPFVGGSCLGGASGMGGGCGMGGHAGHGAGAHEAHAQEVTAPKAMRPVPDPQFDAVRTRRVLEAYDRIVVALSNDRTAGVDEAAALIAKEAPNVTIKETAGPLSVTDEKPDIAKLRERFKPLSAAVVLYVAGNHESLEAALEKDEAPIPRKAYCPMVETAWLQHGDKISNPFYGSSMLRCGEFQDWAEGN